MSISNNELAYTVKKKLIEQPEYLELKKNFLELLEKGRAEILENCEKGTNGLTPFKHLKDEINVTISNFQSNRGRELYFPYISSGFGAGPYIQLEDGSTKMDLIAAIGVNLFGHSHPDLMSELYDSVLSDPMQGNLQPGFEIEKLTKEILKHVGEASSIKHFWPTCSGTMANEIALKIIRQKKFPATKVLAFKDCFAGRSTAMQEITDNAKYREGQPVYGEVAYLDFYASSLGLSASIERTLNQMKEVLTRYPNQFCALMLELVQGEGGLNFAPKEYYEKIFEFSKSKNLAIWVDEIQTFGRTGKLFAYQTFEVEKWVDVVTVGKVLQACGLLYTSEYNPKPGLVAGTFTGSAAALSTGRKIIEMLTQNNYLGKSGKIVELSQYFEKGLIGLSETTCKNKISDIRAIGAMIGFKPIDGTMDTVKKLIFKLYDDDVIVFLCGHDPYLIRMLPPFGVMTKQHIDRALLKIEKAILSL